MNLPSTVSLLKAPNRVNVYLIGTAHFSLESNYLVSPFRFNIISKTNFRPKGCRLRNPQRQAKSSGCGAVFVESTYPETRGEDTARRSKGYQPPKNSQRHQSKRAV